MFGYSPYNNYYSGFNPYGPSYPSSSSYSHVDPYIRALAEERAAREQYEAARRAQQEAQERAARARLAQQQLVHGYASPYTSYMSDEDDGYDDDGYRAYFPYESIPGYGTYRNGKSGPTSRQLEEQKRRERREMLERELAKERELDRLRILQQERARREREEQERWKREAAAEEFYNNMRRGRAFPWEDQRTDTRRANSMAPNQPATRRKPTPSPTSNPRAPSHGHRRTASVQPTSATSQNRTQPESKPVKIPIRTPSPRGPSPTPKQRAAAQTIQIFFRTHYPRRKALKEIAKIRERFEGYKRAFTLPIKVDYRDPRSSSDEKQAIVSVYATGIPYPPPTLETGDATSVPRLAYTSNNGPIHLFDEQLNQLLSALDAVESGGDKEVRERRKELVKQVEGEAGALEAWKRFVWGQREKREEEQEQAKSEGDVEIRDEEAEVERTVEVPNPNAMETDSTAIVPAPASVEATSSDEPGPLPIDRVTLSEPSENAMDVEQQPVPESNPVGDSNQEHTTSQEDSMEVERPTGGVDASSEREAWTPSPPQANVAAPTSAPPLPSELVSPFPPTLDSSDNDDANVSSRPPSPSNFDSVSFPSTPMSVSPPTLMDGIIPPTEIGLSGLDKLGAIPEGEVLNTKGASEGEIADAGTSVVALKMSDTQASEGERREQVMCTGTSEDFVMV